MHIDAFEDSEVDKIIKGNREGVKVLFEDELSIAYIAKEPWANVHFIVAAKDRRLLSL